LFPQGDLLRENEVMNGQVLTKENNKKSNKRQKESLLNWGLFTIIDFANLFSLGELEESE
jgi:hypothetical protein